MKYRRLAKEQLEALHEDFSKFLALQQIDAKEWTDLKENQPEVAEQEIDVFSDLVWEKILNKVEYLEHISPNVLNLFKCNETNIERIVIESEIKDFSSQENIQWILDNLHEDKIQIMKGAKNYTKERNAELFDLIEKGAEFSKGELFEAILSNG
ncbi:hypothetical protein UJ101_02331 [Flavobacteriaceae bacterium UJ101]|nr:hypothetical protein UJ101_02331 [Flavobacteriaceae bacterium UJ101]